MNATVIALRSRTSMPRSRSSSDEFDWNPARWMYVITARAQAEASTRRRTRVAGPPRVAGDSPRVPGPGLRHAHLDRLGEVPEPEPAEERGRRPGGLLPPASSIDLDRDDAIVTGLVERRQDPPEIEAAGPERPAVGLAEVDVPGPRGVEADRLDDRAFLDVHVERVEHDARARGSRRDRPARRPRRRCG